MPDKVTGPASYFPSIEKKYGKPIDEWLALLAGAGIPAAVYDCNSARIGDAQDAWAHGVLSHINPPGRALGWLVGMPVADAVAMVPRR